MSHLHVLPLVAFAFSAFAQAATFTVDATSDASLTGCLPAVPADCSLRGAMLSAEASAGADAIVFDIPVTDEGYIPATAHWRIVATNQLPFLSQSVSIDGTTQPGAAENTLAPDEGGSDAVLKIEVNGADTTSYGFYGYAMTLRGLAINGFRSGNARMDGTGPHRMEGCFVGTDITGMAAGSSNSAVNIGMVVTGSNAIIGGLTPAARNVISGNSYIGVSDQNSNTPANVYQGNIIGLAADGATVIGGQDFGLYSSGHTRGVLIGGDSVAARNLFGGMEFSAIVVDSNSSQTATGQTRIIGNYFGTDFSGTQARGNGWNPDSPSQPYPTILVGRLYRCGVAIGGDAPGEGNLIAHGGQAAVAIGSCHSAPILGNVFWKNRGQPIDLAGSTNFDGHTPNDADDADGTEGFDVSWIYRGNKFQNTPQEISTGENVSADELRLTLRVDSAPQHSAYPLRLDFYATDEFGQQIPLVTESIEETEAQQVQEFVLPLSLFPHGNVGIVVTDAQGNSSEMIVTGPVFSDGFEEP